MPIRVSVNNAYRSLLLDKYNYLDAATSKSSTFLLRTTIDISAVQIFGLKYISAMA